MTNGSVFMGLKPYLTHMLISMLVYWRVERWCSLWGSMLYSHNMAISGPWSAGDLLIHLWEAMILQWKVMVRVQESSSSQGMKDGNQVQSKHIQTNPNQPIIYLRYFRFGMVYAHLYWRYWRSTSPLFQSTVGESHLKNLPVVHHKPAIIDLLTYPRHFLSFLDMRTDHKLWKRSVQWSLAA